MLRENFTGYEGSWLLTKLLQPFDTFSSDASVPSKSVLLSLTAAGPDRKANRPQHSSVF